MSYARQLLRIRSCLTIAPPIFVWWVINIFLSLFLIAFRCILSELQPSSKTSSSKTIEHILSDQWPAQETPTTWQVTALWTSVGYISSQQPCSCVYLCCSRVAVCVAKEEAQTSSHHQTAPDPPATNPEQNTLNNTFDPTISAYYNNSWTKSLHRINLLATTQPLQDPSPWFHGKNSIMTFCSWFNILRYSALDDPSL